jgi:hypothetical protein
MLRISRNNAFALDSGFDAIIAHDSGNTILTAFKTSANKLMAHTWGTITLLHRLRTTNLINLRK